MPFFFLLAIHLPGFWIQDHVFQALSHGLQRLIQILDFDVPGVRRLLALAGSGDKGDCYQNGNEYCHGLSKEQPEFQKKLQNFLQTQQEGHAITMKNVRMTAT